MANHLISEKDLHDDFLSAMIRSDESAQAPEGFMDEVLNRISLLPSVKTIKPYSPPRWLKWGIPGVMLTCLIGLLIWGFKKPINPDSGLTALERVFNKINSWISGLKFDIDFPILNNTGTIVWIVAGFLILIWSFLLLSRFLEKKYGTDH
jgi:hypothetical protein